MIISSKKIKTLKVKMWYKEIRSKYSKNKKQCDRENIFVNLDVKHMDETYQET